MQDIISNILTAGASSGVTGSLICLLLKSYLNNRDKERDQLVNDVQKLSETIRVLKDENVRKLEVKIENHISEDKTDRLLTLVEGIANRQHGIENKISKQSDDTAKQSIEIGKLATRCEAITEKLAANYEATYRYIDNLDKSFQAHKTQDIRIMQGGK